MDVYRLEGPSYCPEWRSNPDQCEVLGNNRSFNHSRYHQTLSLSLSLDLMVVSVAAPVSDPQARQGKAPSALAEAGGPFTLL